MLHAGNAPGQLPEVILKETSGAFSLGSSLREVESETWLHSGKISIAGEVLGSQYF